jgi:hypothetical protein
MLFTLEELSGISTANLRKLALFYRIDPEGKNREKLIQLILSELRQADVTVVQIAHEPEVKVYSVKVQRAMESLKNA